MSKNDDADDPTRNRAPREPELSEEEIAEAEAAIALATLPEGDPLPPHVREQVEAAARSVLGNRAKAHALKRAREREGIATTSEGRAPRPPSLQSTTGAGSQIIGAVEGRETARPSPLFAWGGWGFAAAAAIALVVSHARSSSSAGAGDRDRGASSAPSVDRVALRGEDGTAGELRYDRTRGTGVVAFAKAPAWDPEHESLELWVALEGDVSLRPVDLIDATSGREASFGEGKPLCHSAVLGDPSAPRCSAIRSVVITREERRGTMIFEDNHAVLRSVTRP